MSDKPFRDSENGVWLIARIILVIAAIAFTYYGFFIKQECDIDEQYLWCRLHPASVLQIIGVMFFYISVFILSGIWGKWFTLWEQENTTRYNTAAFLLTILSALAIWFG